MKELYKTKPNVNGNTYYLLIDHENETFRTNCSFWTSADSVITTTKRTLQALKTACKNNGYKYIEHA